MKRTKTGEAPPNARTKPIGARCGTRTSRPLIVLGVLSATTIGVGCGHEPARPAGGSTTSQQRSVDAESTTLLTGTSGVASSPLLPRPRAMTPTSCDQPFAIDGATTIAVDDTPEARRVGQQLARWLGLPPKSVATLAIAAPDPAAGIVLRSSAGAVGGGRDPSVAPPSTLDDEAYSLAVDPRRALVRSRSSRGLFYGAQTLAQLAGARRIGEEGAVRAQGTSEAPRNVPCLTIDDAPRFRYRAMHLDVARHFFPKEIVKRYIDLLAFYRFNVFHWHLTDDQGFRIQIKSHPELTTTGGPDGAYSQEDAREIIAYAQARSITVIPEIEMPGHVRALLASHPELSCTGKKQDVPRTWGIFEDVLCAGNEKSFALIDEILAEIAPLFPSELLHVGGDEVPPTRWQACAKCRAAMKANNVGIHELEGYVMRRVASTLQKLGKRPVVWDEALEGLAGGSRAGSTVDASARPVILAWQSAARGREAARRGFDVIMAPNEHAYLNFFQSRTRTEPGHSGYLPWSAVRTFDPLGGISDEHERARIIGGEGALWSEYITSPVAIDTMVMPRAAALAETLWSGPSASEEDFIARFGEQLPMLDASKVHYFVDPPEGAPKRKILVEGESATFTLGPPRLFPGAVMRWTRDGSDPTPTSPLVTGPITIRETTAIAAASFLPSGRSSPVVRGNVVVETPRPAVTTTTTRGTSYAYAEGNFHELPDFGKVHVKARGRALRVSLADLGAKLRPERFAVLFEGLVEARADGVHRFVVRADDGVRLEVDGEKLLEDDGEHEPRESSGEIALARGLHRFRITYFQGTEGKELDVKLEGPSLPLGPLAPLSEAKP